MIGDIWHRACACVGADVCATIVARRAVPSCSACGALFSTDKPIETAEGIMRAALVRLSTEVLVRSDDGVEGYTRRIQKIAAEALREADGR